MKETRQNYIDSVELGGSSQSSTPVIEVADTADPDITGTEVMR